MQINTIRIFEINLTHMCDKFHRIFDVFLSFIFFFILSSYSCRCVVNKHAEEIYFSFDQWLLCVQVYKRTILYDK